MARPLATLVALLTPKRRWAQFSLLTMFVVVTVLCVALSLVVAPAERQRRAVAAIKALDGRVDYVKPSEEASEAFPRPFLRRWLPQDYFDEVRKVDFRFDQGKQVTDAGLAHLQGLTGLQELNLSGSQVTNTGLAHLQGLTALRNLTLSGTRVTDAGLAHLHKTTRLHVLDLGGTQVKDAGLAHLHGLTELLQLSLSGTQVTGTGLEHLRGLTGLGWLQLDVTQVTDAGLANLQGLTGLQELYLSGAQVTDARMAQLRQALPNCAINRP